MGAFGTYLGGRFDEWNVNLALVGANSAVLSGWTQSADYPATPTAHDTILNDDGIAGVGVPTDGFLARITLQPDGDGDDTVDAPELFSPASGASVGTNTLLTFDWSDVCDPSGIDGYHIQLNRRPDFVCCNDWVEVWTSTSEHVNSVRFDGPYYWRVQTTDRSGNLSEWSEVRTFNSGLAISAFTVNPSTVEGGNTLQGQVALSASAPAGGAVVSLSSSNAGIARVPASVNVPAGATSATFTVTTRSVTTATPVTLSASYNGASRTASLNVQPAPPPPPPPGPVTLSTLALSPASVTGGNSSQGTVTLSDKGRRQQVELVIEVGDRKAEG